MSNFAPSSHRVPTVSRNVVIAGSVLVLHAAALWALQSGLLRRAVEIVVPVEILSSIVTPPAPVSVTPPALPAPLPPEKPRPVMQRPRPAPARAPAPPPAPLPIAVPSPAPAPQAPVGVTEPQPPAPPITEPVAAAPAPALPPAPAPAPPPPPAAVELPSTNADYLQNPQPPYPPISRRLREQGRVLLRVQISAQGAALDAQVKQSSGYERLDRAALEAVRTWRYVPGKRGGVPETMWFDVPLNFVLD